MTYAALSDVQALLPKFTLNGDSTPTATQVGEFLEQIDGEINSVIAAAGYAVPVAAPAYFVETLRGLNSYGAAALTLRAMFPMQRAAGEDSQSEGALYQRWYEQGLKNLKSGAGIPPETPSTGATNVGPSSYFTRNPNQEEDLGDIAEPRFKMGEVF